MDARIIVTVACAFIAALNIPLVLRKVPPNAIYGFRTRRTLSDTKVWYPANVFAGWAMLVAVAVTVCATWLAPAAWPAWFPAAVLVGAIIAVLAASFLHLRSYG